MNIPKAAKSDSKDDEGKVREEPVLVEDLKNIIRSYT